MQNNSKKFMIFKKLSFENKLKLVEYPNFARERLPVYKFWYKVYYQEMSILIFITTQPRFI